jgi:hypothetical protein
MVVACMAVSTFSGSFRIESAGEYCLHVFHERAKKILQALERNVFVRPDAVSLSCWRFPKADTFRCHTRISSTDLAPGSRGSHDVPRGMKAMTVRRVGAFTIVLRSSYDS